MLLKNKVAVITGSSSNIGKAIALRLGKEGVKIVVNSKSHTKEGEDVVETLKKSGVDAIYVRADVSDEGDAKKLINAAVKKFGTIDILVNNAGRTTGMPFFEMTKANLLEQFDSNFFGTVLCSKEAAKIMKQKGSGKIINTASIRGISYTGREGVMAYSAAKAAVINFTKTLAKELAPSITVNAVAPGFVITPNYDKTSEEQKKAFIDGTLIKRWIKPDEIADAYLFLATSEIITGQILIADGGFTLKVG